MASTSINLGGQMDAVAHRAEFIELLDQEGPLATRDIVDALEHSRSTVTRALRNLRDAGLIEKTEDGYNATLPGVLAANQYRRYETASEAILTSKDLLTAIPNQHAPPVDLLIGAETISADTEIPVRPLEAISDRVRDADTVHVYLPTLINTHLLRVWHRAVVTQTNVSEAIFTSDLLTALKGQYPHLLSEMASVEGFSAFATSGPPYGIVLTTTEDTTTVSVIVYENDATVHGVITNESAAAVEWGQKEFERLKHDATVVTADLEALSAAVADGLADRSPSRVGPSSPRSADHDAAGHALPLDLEADGFVQLSSEYFNTHTQASPAVSWRTGFTLAEVHAGHAVDRVTDDDQNLTDYLIEQLRASTDYVVLGSPGSGKSTICMAVACDWYTRELGPVLYRERGSGDHFTSTAMLEAYLRQTDGHTLIVVEDAIRDEANAILDVMQALDEDGAATFLLDARSHEWQDTETGIIDARRDAYRRTAIDSITVPDLDEHECTRFVTQFTELVDADVTLSGADLFSLVQEGTAADGDDERSTGAVLIAQHYLARQINSHVDASVEPPTALDEAVHQMYQKLADAEPGLTLELTVLVNILNAAGLPVAKEYLYAITSDDEYDTVDEALSLLEGDLLFESAHPRVSGPTTYRTRHETWSYRFLEQFWDHTPAQRARSRFGQCITAVLALADDSDQRHQIKQHLGGRTPHLHQIEANPEHWADETIARIFKIGRSNADFAPLFGETTTAQIKLPDACSEWSDVQQAYWRGEMNRLHGDFNRAEREFRTLRERAENSDLSDQQGLQHALPGVSHQQDSDDDVQCESSAQRKHWQAISFTKLGHINEYRGKLDSAREYLEESLDIFRELDDRHGEVRALGWLGEINYSNGDLNKAAKLFEESHELSREIGDRHGESKALIHNALISFERGEHEAAKEHLEECLTLCREIGDRYNEAEATEYLGLIALERDSLAFAEEHLEKGLTLYREIGYLTGEARALTHLGNLVSKRGELEAAEEYYEQSLSLSHDVGLRGLQANTLLCLGEIDRKRGELETAEEYYEEGRTMFSEMDVPHKEAEALKHLGNVARERGELAQAQDWFAEAADLYISTGVAETATALTNVVDVCEQQGNTDAALNWCDRAIEFAEQTNRNGMKEEFTTRRSELVDTDEQ